MIKYLLVIKICYAIAQFCGPGLESNILYDNFRDCALEGYTKSHEIILSMPPVQVESTQTIIKFYCIEKETEVAPILKGTPV